MDRPDATDTPDDWHEAATIRSVIVIFVYRRSVQKL